MLDPPRQSRGIEEICRINKIQENSAHFFLEESVGFLLNLVDLLTGKCLDVDINNPVGRKIVNSFTILGRGRVVF